MLSIDSITPTLCLLMQIEIPFKASAEPIQSILDAGKQILGKSPVEKCFIYLPDAIGEFLYRDYKADFNTVIKLAPIEIKIESIYPSYTPVCFASMFSGSRPETHGIRKYEKPILKIDTIFDSLSREGKKVALITVKDSSMDLIFKNKQIEYYTEPYDPEVRERVLRILYEKDHDFIVAYQQEYDDVMHNSTPRSPEALSALKRHIEGFQTLTMHFLEKYGDKNRLIGFFPDHGAHINPETGKGTHGTKSTEDMKLRHFWGIYKGSRSSGIRVGSARAHIR